MDKFIVGVVEDEEALRGLLVECLRLEGYEVVESATAASMLDHARQGRFHAFLLDIQIGREDGIELCRQIRAIGHHKLTPILFMTGLDTVGIMQKAFGAGADDFVEKPVDFSALKARLKAHVQKIDYFGKLDRAHQMLKRYLSPHIAAIAQEYSETGKIPLPVERNFTFCFTDIRGFTALSESLDPAELFSRLNAHLHNQIELIYHYGGYVDKFGGDGLMAVFDGEDMVAQCCLCALNIIDSANRVIGDETFPIGIGIHTGRAVVGNIGSPTHLDYTVVGASVNLAARLCGYAQPGTIVVSNAVRQAACLDRRLQFHNQQQVKIRGFADPVTIYAVLFS